MKKILVLFICIATGCSVQSKMDSLSGTASMVNKKSYPKARDLVFDMQQKARLAFLNKYRDTLFTVLQDTIYFIDGFVSESNLEYGSVWTKTRKIDYTYQGGNVKIREQKFLSDEQVKAVLRWDVAFLTENGRKHGNGFDTNLIIFVNRFYRKNKKWMEDHFNFKYY